MKYKYTKEKLQEVVRTSYSIAECLRKLNMSTIGGNYQTLKERFKDWNIDTSHFRGKGWNVGLKFVPNCKKPLKEVLKKDSKFASYHLKRRLIREEIKEHICEHCKLKTWMDQLIPLELHHINGVKDDNRIENIELLCPNCHALTDNYRGKNIGLPKKKFLE